MRNKIKELQEEVEALQEKNMRLNESLLVNMRRAEEVCQNIKQEKEKYARLLERYITMMEKVAKVESEADI